MPDTHNDPDNSSSRNEGSSQPQNEPRTTSPSSSSDTSVRGILNALLARQSSGAPLILGSIGLTTLEQLLRDGLVSVTEEDPDEVGGDLEEEYDDDDDDDYYASFHRHSHNWFKEVTEPQAAGVELLKSGDFGRVAPKLRSRGGDLNIARTVLNRNIRSTVPLYREEYTNNLVPNTNGTTVASYGANIYTAQFSDDSSFYYTCAQDFRLHVFDTTVPRTPWNEAFSSHGQHRHGSNLRTTMHVRKTIQGHPGRWTITDANLSPDNERMIYSSITPTAYVTSTAPDGSPAQIPIPFSDPRRRGRHDSNVYDDGFGIWSCRFSADGNEVVAGGSKKIFVYDLLANRRTVKINAHNDDVNSCCWADTASGNILISASDDTFLKVWDRRSLGSSQKPSGVLIGHTEGITYVSAKGDGRYIISNGKDQALRLWDLRKMRSSQEYDSHPRRSYGVDNYDYRYPHYPKPKYEAHPLDCSVMTYRGHAVLRTLIRCHFSPAETTGGQYIYSGSADGKIHIWSLDGTIAQVLDRSRTLPASFDASGPEPEALDGHRMGSCVRDVSWHSQEPVLMSAGWESRGGSIIARHEWKGLTKMPGAIEDWVEKRRLEEAELDEERRHARRVQARRRTGRLLPGSYEDDDEDIF